MVPCFLDSVNSCTNGLHRETAPTRVSPVGIQRDTTVSEDVKTVHGARAFDWRQDTLIIDNNCLTLNVYPQDASYNQSCNNESRAIEFLRSDISKEIQSSLENVKGIHRNELDFLKSTISWCSDNSVYHSTGQSKSPDSKLPDDIGRPTPGQLMEMKERLTEIMPNFFCKQADYSIYDPNIIFENNIWKKRTVGIGKYSLNISMIRIGAHMKYTNVVLHILKITSHPEDGCIRARWRISGLPQAKSLMIWRYYPGKFRENVKKDSQWIDGISTFYLNKNGKIYKHVADNVIPDDEVSTVEAEVDPKIAPVGLMSKTDLNNFVYSLLHHPTSVL